MSDPVSEVRYCKRGHPQIPENKNKHNGCKLCKKITEQARCTKRKAKDEAWAEVVAAALLLPCPVGARLIPLGGKKGKGLHAIVDEADYPELIQYRWQLNCSGYATRGDYQGKQGNGRYAITTVFMARQIMDFEGDYRKTVVDHISGDKLDNRRSNLRIVPATANAINAGRRKDNKSGYKGVWFNKDKQRWESAIRVDKRPLHLGTFGTPEEAAAAYAAAAEKYHGEYRRLTD